jgi:hypothetical protein
MFYERFILNNNPGGVLFFFEKRCGVSFAFLQAQFLQKGPRSPLKKIKKL